jgi:hypothetical protein
MMLKLTQLSGFSGGGAGAEWFMLDGDFDDNMRVGGVYRHGDFLYMRFTEDDTTFDEFIGKWDLVSQAWAWFVKLPVKYGSRVPNYWGIEVDENNDVYTTASDSSSYFHLFKLDKDNGSLIAVRKTDYHMSSSYLFEHPQQLLFMDDGDLAMTVGASLRTFDTSLNEVNKATTPYGFSGIARDGLIYDVYTDASLAKYTPQKFAFGDLTTPTAYGDDVKDPVNGVRAGYACGLGDGGLLFAFTNYSYLYKFIFIVERFNSSMESVWRHQWDQPLYYCESAYGGGMQKNADGLFAYHTRYTDLAGKTASNYYIINLSTGQRVCRILTENTVEGTSFLNSNARHLTADEFIFGGYMVNTASGKCKSFIFCIPVSELSVPQVVMVGNYRIEITDPGTATIVAPITNIGVSGSVNSLAAATTPAGSTSNTTPPSLTKTL